MSFILFAIIIVFTAIQTLVLRDRDSGSPGLLTRFRAATPATTGGSTKGAGE